MKTQNIFLITASVLAAGGMIAMQSCQSMPKGATPVNHLDSKKYLGKWYEIARFDFKHEKDLNQVTAEYQLNDDGTINVLNKGYDFIKNEWKSSEGKAKFVENDSVGRLKVSFFGPFYAPYNIISVDEEYQYALVFGKNTDYVWMLSRDTQIPEHIKQKYLRLMRESGYDLDRLVWVDQKPQAAADITN